MDIFFNMSAVQAAALYVGLLVAVMLGLKIYVGLWRGKLQIPSGETTPEFSRVSRVQLNAVEDVPALMAGIIALALLGMPVWYIHAVGLALVVARVLHAVGLASSSGFSLGRVIGAVGTVVVYFAVAGALLVHAFAPPV